MVGITEHIQKMEAGNASEIIDCFTSESALLRTNAIVFSVVHELRGNPVTINLRCLTKDRTFLLGYQAGWCVSDFAYAALDILGIEPYNGNNKNILSLIESRLAM